MCRYSAVSEEVINLCGYRSLCWEGELRGTFPDTAEPLPAAPSEATQLPTARDAMGTEAYRQIPNAALGYPLLAKGPGSELPGQ